MSVNIFQRFLAYLHQPHSIGTLLLDAERLAQNAAVVLDGHRDELNYVVDHIKALEDAKVEVARDLAKASAILAQAQVIAKAGQTIVD